MTAKTCQTCRDEETCQIRTQFSPPLTAGCSQHVPRPAETAQDAQDAAQDDSGVANGRKTGHDSGGEAENALQRQAEAFLTKRGYLRLTPKAMIRAKIDPPRGFFGHWNENRGNPLMADLLVMDFPLTRVPLMLELKVRDRWQPGQKQAAGLRLWRVAWCMEDVRREVDAWDNGKEQT